MNSRDLTPKLVCPRCGCTVDRDLDPHWPYRGKFYCSQYCAQMTASPPDANNRLSTAHLPLGVRRHGHCT